VTPTLVTPLVKTTNRSNEIMQDVLSRIVPCMFRLLMATVHKTVGQDDQYVKKFRRRRSDARWRANLASCYETLKLVIPLTTRASKKRISKVAQLRANVLLYLLHFYASTLS